MAKSPRLNFTVSQVTMNGLAYLKSLPREAGGSSSASSAVRKMTREYLANRGVDIDALPNRDLKDVEVGTIANGSDQDDEYPGIEDL